MLFILFLVGILIVEDKDKRTSDILIIVLAFLKASVRTSIIVKNKGPSTIIKNKRFK